MPYNRFVYVTACACRKCKYVNHIHNHFCTECGFPLHNENLITDYYNRIHHLKDLKVEAQTSILITRVFLFCMGGFILTGATYMFIKFQQNTVIMIMAIILSALFFMLALWSKKNAFIALLTSFVVLMTFTAINIFAKFAETFTTLTGVMSMVVCLVLLFIVLKGVQAAYRISIIDEELQTA